MDSTVSCNIRGLPSRSNSHFCFSSKGAHLKITKKLVPSPLNRVVAPFFSVNEAPSSSSTCLFTPVWTQRLCCRRETANCNAEAISAQETEVLTNARLHRPWTRLRRSFWETEVRARTKDPRGPLWDISDDYRWVLFCSDSLSRSLFNTLHFGFSHFNFASFLTPTRPPSLRLAPGQLTSSTSNKR